MPSLLHEVWHTKVVEFETLQVTRQLEGVLLVKAHAVEAIQDREYFLKQIERCEQNFEVKLADGSLRKLLESNGS